MNKYNLYHNHNDNYSLSFTLSQCLWWNFHKTRWDIFLKWTCNGLPCPQEWIHACMYEWMNLCMYEWISKWLNVWMPNSSTWHSRSCTVRSLPTFQPFLKPDLHPAGWEFASQFYQIALSWVQCELFFTMSNAFHLFLLSP